MTRSKNSETSSSSEDGRKPKKKNKHSDSESSDGTKSTVNKKKDYKQIILETTQEENEYRRQLYPDFHRVMKEDITCTVCSKDLKKDVSLGKTIYSHPILKVLHCRKCSEVHNDSDCDGLACIWCKDDDSLFNCVSCTSQLCEDCIKKNLGKKVLKDAEDDYWRCILCNPRVLWGCRAKCWAALEKARSVRLKKGKAALTALVEKRKMTPKRPARRRAGKEDMETESDAKTGSSDESEDSSEGTSTRGLRGEVRTSEDSDVEDVYSSTGAEKARQCVKRKKPRKDRRSSRSFSENKGDETEDSESGTDSNKNGGTPRRSKRTKNLQPLPKTNGTLVSSSSDSSSDEDDARKRREKTGVDGAIEDVLSVGEMLVDQIENIKKKFKSAITAGDSNAKGLAIKKLVNVVKIGIASLTKVELDLDKCGDGPKADDIGPIESVAEEERAADIFNVSTQELVDSGEDANVAKSEEIGSPKESEIVPNGDIDLEDGVSLNNESKLEFSNKVPIIRLKKLADLMDTTDSAEPNESDTAHVPSDEKISSFKVTDKKADISHDMFSDDSVSSVKGAGNDEDLSESLLANPLSSLSPSRCEPVDVPSPSSLKNGPPDNSPDEDSRGASPQPQGESDVSSDEAALNNDEAAAKKGLLDSSSDESEGRSKKRKLKVKEEKTKEEGKKVEESCKTGRLKKGKKPSFLSNSYLSSSESEDDLPRGEKRSATDDDKPKKKRKPSVEDVDVKNDLKLKSGCSVNIKKMSEDDMEKYLSALQEHYLEDDDSRDREREIDRLGDLSKLRRKRRGNGSEDDNDDEDEKKTENRKERNRKAKTKDQGLMEFLDEEENGEQNSSGNVEDLPESEKQKEKCENSVNMWNNMNKEFLLDDSADDDEYQCESDVDVEMPDDKSEVKGKVKVEPAEVKETIDEEVNKEVNEVNEEEVKKEVDKEDGEGPTSDKEGTKDSSSDEKSKKGKKSWRKNRLLTGKLSDTDSDEGQAASQRKEERRMEEGSEEEERKCEEKEMRKDSKLSRAKKVRRHILKSDSDSDIRSTDKSSSDDTFAKKKKKKVSNATASEKSSEEETIKKKPKRRRIKVQDSSSSSGDDQQNSEKTDTPNKGRKKIRKMFTDNELLEETKEAAKVEEERRKRIAERKKMYDEMYEALQTSATAGQKVDKLVLDFDDKTKEPLVEVHPKIVEKLKPHQVKGIKFMWDASYESLERIKKTKGSGCILAHCMGLGKTFQVVALCHTLLKNPECNTRSILVVSPLSTVLNWCNEFDKWLKGLGDDDEEEIYVYNLTKQKKNYERQYQLKNWQETGGVMVLGYDMYRILSNPAGKKVRASITKTFQESLVDPGPDLVICDEGHLLKNESTALARSMSRIKTLRRIVLTGTPLQNNLREYHCMVQFVKPNLLGTRKEFLNRFVNPITNGQFEDSTAHDVKVMKRRAHVLHRMLEGSVQRYDYSVLTPFLPPKQEYVISIRVSDLQERLYTHYLEHVSRMTSAPDEDGRPTTGKGATLFKDFQSLQRVWTHPLVLKWSSHKQEKEREKRAESDSEGSLRDFIDDDDVSDTPSEASSSSSEDDIVCLDSDDENQKKKKKEKDTKKVRRTRSSKKEESEEEVVQEAPKSQLWWEQFVTEDHLEDLRESPKLVLLFSILKECEALGEKVLVFSQSLYSLDLIEHFLGKVDAATENDEDDEKLLNHRGSWTKTIDYFRLDGSTPTDIRAAWCKSFNKENNTRGRLFLISTRAGGLGINLVAANRVVLFDASWNPSHDLQSIFRVYRFGQKRPVFVYRFLAQGTMEEKIYERQVTKLSLAGRVVDEHQIDRHYNMADLQELYRFTPNKGPQEIPKLPKDRMFADMLKEHGERIVSYHEHDSLLENKEDEELNEEERKEAWEDYEKEKTGLSNMFGGVAGGMPGLPTQTDILNAIKFTNPTMTDADMRAALPQVLSDLYKLNTSNPAQMGQQMMAMQQLLLQQQQRQPKPPNIIPNYQSAKNLSYQQQQMYAYQQQQRNAQQYMQRAAATTPYLPSPNAAFVPLTNDNYRRAYGSLFTNSMGFNQPNVAFNQPGTSQGQGNRQPTTKVINIQTPARK